MGVGSLLQGEAEDDHHHEEDHPAERLDVLADAAQQFGLLGYVSLKLPLTLVELFREHQGNLPPPDPAPNRVAAEKERHHQSAEGQFMLHETALKPGHSFLSTIEHCPVALVLSGRAVYTL